MSVASSPPPGGSANGVSPPPPPAPAIGPFSRLVDTAFARQCAAHVSPPRLPAWQQVEQTVRTPGRLKALLRAGAWPPGHDCRCHLWTCLSQLGQLPANADDYTAMAAQTFGQGETSHDVSLPAFVDPTRTPHYHLNGVGVEACRRVACVLATACPDITFAPVLAPVAALFLHYMDEAGAYTALYVLLRDRRAHLAQTSIAYDAAKYVLCDLARKYAKPMCQYISKCGMQIEGILQEWIWWIFADLKFPHLVRVMDCFLFEGPKVLYRVALAILILYHKLVVKTAKKPDPVLVRDLSQFCEDMPVSPDALLKVAFDIRGFSRKALQKLMTKWDAFVRRKRLVSPLQPILPNSASCESLNVLVSQSSKGPLSLEGLESHLITAQQWQVVWGWLPSRMVITCPQLLYNSNEDGTSLTTFYRKVAEQEPMLLLIRTTAGELIGAYCSKDWSERNNHRGGYYGNGETFIFRLLPTARKYGWVGLDGPDGAKQTSENLFMSGDMTHIAVGGGEGVGLQIDQDMLYGRTEACQTFNNAPLVAGNDFKCGVVQAFGFV